MAFAGAAPTQLRAGSYSTLDLVVTDPARDVIGIYAQLETLDGTIIDEIGGEEFLTMDLSQSIFEQFIESDTVSYKMGLSPISAPAGNYNLVVRVYDSNMQESGVSVPVEILEPLQAPSINLHSMSGIIAYTTHNTLGVQVSHSGGIDTIQIDITGDVASETHLTVDGGTLTGLSYFNNFQLEPILPTDEMFGLISVQVTATGTNGLSLTKTMEIQVLPSGMASNDEVIDAWFHPVALVVMR